MQGVLQQIVGPLFSTAAGLSTLLGLAGLIVACVFLAFLFKTRHDLNQLTLIPSAQRARHLDNMLSRYKLNARDIPSEEKSSLLREEMRLRFKKDVFYAGLGAGVFVVCLATVAVVGLPRPLPSRQATPADLVVENHMEDVLKVRGDYEALDRNPATLDQIRMDALHLADLMNVVDDKALNPSRRVIKDEYGGWALLIAARTYRADDTDDRNERLRLARDANERLDRAVAKMEAIKEGYSAGDKDAAEDYDWMTGKSADWDRTQYLKAMGLAIIANSAGAVSSTEVQKQLNLVSKSFLETYPPKNVDVFKSIKLN